MAAFAPPPLSSLEPEAAFRPPPLSSLEPETEKPAFFDRMVEGSSLLSSAIHPIEALKSLTGMGDVKKAMDHYANGDNERAALQLAEWITTNPATRAAYSLIDTSKDQFTKGWKKMQEKDYAGAIDHFGAGVLPILAPAANGVDLMKEGDIKGGLGLAAGNALDLAAPLASKVKIPPGAGRTAAGAGGVVAGGVATMAGHPYIGVPAMGISAEMLARGVEQMRAGRTPPPLPSPPSAAELGIRANLDKLGQPDNHFQPIPQAAVQPPPLPVQPAPVAVQPVVPPGTPPEVRAMAPIEQHDTSGTTVANRQADLTSGVKPLQGLIDMLERRKSLTVGEQAMLAKAKAELGTSSPSVPRGTTNVESATPNVTNGTSVTRDVTPPPAAERAYVDAENTGLGKSQKEISNRTAKAQRFISKLGGTQNMPRTDAEWSTLAKDMGENIPSAETKELITKGLNNRMVNGQEKPGASVPSLQQQLSDSLRLANLKKSFPWETKEQLMERLKK